MGMGIGRVSGLIVASASVAFLVGCGGSGDDDDDQGDVVDECGTPNGTVVIHSAYVEADETWEGNGVTHSVPSGLRINEATLTVEACAIVSLGADAGLTVVGNPEGSEARLIAAGTGADRFVSFVRADDNTPWGRLQGLNQSSFIELHHTVVRGAGDGSGTSYRRAAIVMGGSAYADPPVGLLAVDNVTLDAPQGAGIYFDTNAAFTADSTQLVVQDAPDHPLVMTMMAVGSIPDGTYTGNGKDDALIFGQFNVFADMTIRKRLPVRIATSNMRIGGPINDTTPVTLTLEPGVEMRFEPLGGNPGAMMIFGSNGNAPDNKVGVLLAEGTEAEPILFTSGAATPAAGDWAGVWLDTANGSRLDHVIIEYAGGENGISSANCRPETVTDDAALVVGDFEDQYVPPADLITSSVIRFSGGSAIDGIWVGPELGPALTGNGNTISDYAECMQTYNSVAGPMVCPMVGCFSSASTSSQRR